MSCPGNPAVHFPFVLCFSPFLCDTSLQKESKVYKQNTPQPCSIIVCVEGAQIRRGTGFTHEMSAMPWPLSAKYFTSKIYQTHWLQKPWILRVKSESQPCWNLILHVTSPRLWPSNHGFHTSYMHPGAGAGAGAGGKKSFAVQIHSLWSMCFLIWNHLLNLKQSCLSQWFRENWLADCPATGCRVFFLNCSLASASKGLSTQEINKDSCCGTICSAAAISISFTYFRNKTLPPCWYFILK